MKYLFFGLPSPKQSSIEPANQETLNIQMSILKAIGIILVVIGHKQINWRLLPIYSFHMPLFFFISGYFYKEKYDNSHFLFIRKKIKSLLLPYYFYNVIFLIITISVNSIFSISLGKNVTAFNFFVEPFITGHQYYFFLAAWFVPQLFVVQIVYNHLNPIFKKVGARYPLKFCFFVVLALSAIYFSNKGFNKNPIFLVISRTCFGMLFYFLGSFFKSHLERYNIFTSGHLAIIIAMQWLMLHNFKSLHYSMLRADFNTHIYLPILSSITGIYFCLFVSKSLSLFLKNNDILVKIGNNSFHIMAGHILVFFCFSYMALKLTGGDLHDLHNIWYSYDNNKYWFIYVSGGVLIPTAMALLIKKTLCFLRRFY